MTLFSIMHKHLVQPYSQQKIFLSIVLVQKGSIWDDTGMSTGDESDTEQ